MARAPKPKVDHGELTVELYEIPYVAYKSDHPALSGYSFVGRTQDEALTNASAFFARYFKQRGYWPINVEIKD